MACTYYSPLIRNIYVYKYATGRFHAAVPQSGVLGLRRHGNLLYDVFGKVFWTWFGGINISLRVSKNVAACIVGVCVGVRGLLSATEVESRVTGATY